jgi:hypothetical protein
VKAIYVGMIEKIYVIYEKKIFFKEDDLRAFRRLFFHLDSTPNKKKTLKIKTEEAMSFTSEELSVGGSLWYKLQTVS